MTKPIIVVKICYKLLCIAQVIFEGGIFTNFANSAYFVKIFPVKLLK